MASIRGKSKKLRLLNNNNNKKDEIASQRCQKNPERNLLAVENKSLSKPIDLEIPEPYAFGSQESKVREGLFNSGPVLLLLLKIIYW